MSQELSHSPSEMIVTESDTGNSPSPLQTLPVAGEEEAQSFPMRQNTASMPRHPLKRLQHGKALSTKEESSIPAACNQQEVKMCKLKAEQERSEGVGKKV